VGGRKGTPIPVEKRKMTRQWDMTNVAYVLNCGKTTVFRYLNGSRYPELRMMRKIEHVFGWPASEQVKLIPLAGYDAVYGLVFRQVLDENNGRFLNPDNVQPHKLTTRQLEFAYTLEDLLSLPLHTRIVTNTNRVLFLQPHTLGKFWFGNGKVTPWSPDPAWLPAIVLPPVVLPLEELEP
jgi:hypothetical protein